MAFLYNISIVYFNCKINSFFSYQIPYPDISGVCSTTTFIQYMQNLDLKSCYQTIVEYEIRSILKLLKSLTDQCFSGSPLSAEYYLNRNIIGNPSTPLSSYFKITASNYFVYNSTTNQYSQTTNSSTITSKTTSNSLTCQNTVAGIILYFQTGSNIITNVQADVYYAGDITVNFTNNSTQINQFFSVKFVDGSVKI